MRRANLGARTRAPHKTFALNAVPETGGLGDRSRNLSADTIAVEIDLVRRPFQVLLRSHPINFAISYLSNRRTRGPTSVPYAYPDSVGYRPCSGRLRPTSIAVCDLVPRDIARTRLLGLQGASNGGKGKAHASLSRQSLRSTACSISLSSKHTHLT